MSGNSPPARSPERLTLHSIDRVETKHGTVRISVTIDYDPWGDGDIWDAVHGVNAVHRVIYKSAQRAESKRRAAYVASLSTAPDAPVGHDRVLLEHTKTWLVCHPADKCMAQVCSLHARTDHGMRSFPQHWRADRYLMERVCPHGVGHPDPDDFTLMSGDDSGSHGCDGCCSSA